MTLNQLEYFCAVCRYHSITRAAESLFVSQPTISTSIRNLEKEFHLRLFTHGQNRITLTNDGSLFYKKAEYILHRAHEMYTDFSDKDTNKAPLRIGITSTPSALLLPSFAMEFEEKYGIPVKLMECSSMHARELVDNDELDVAIANLDFYNLDNYDYHTVIEDTYVYCVDKNHHLAKEPSVSFETLKEEPIILFNTDSVQSHTVITGFPFRRSNSAYQNVLQPADDSPQLSFCRQLWCLPLLGNDPSGKHREDSCRAKDQQPVWPAVEERRLHHRPPRKIHPVHGKLQIHFYESSPCHCRT